MMLCIATITNAQQSKREWRAVWIATVNNIDWPSKPGLTTDQQKKELIDYLDLFKSLNFNAIVLQVRPTADAFYKSKLEPWSIYLTGNQNTAPNPEYDPLAFAIEESHKRGIELHAWLNPYRVLQDTADIKLMSPNHIYFKKPQLFVRHGKKLYFDPAYPETREFLCEVIKDIVSRYDVDGIHFDDYFYPNNDFSDSLSFATQSRGFADKMAWRRDNVDLVVKMLRDTLLKVAPQVKFGISPYAVWRNKAEDPRGSESKSFSYTNYDHLHADILKWMENGWTDYILPQLYFNIGYENADFIKLKNWWADNRNKTEVYAGIGTYRLDSKAKIAAWREVSQIARQIDSLRADPRYKGACYFNARNFKENILGINAVIKEKYAQPALLPVDARFEAVVKAKVSAATKKVKEVRIHFQWEDLSKKEKSVYYYAIYKCKKGAAPSSRTLIAITGVNSFSQPVEKVKYDYYISVLDRFQNEGEIVKFK